MIGEKLGHIFDRPLSGVARYIPLHPNTLTVTGFLLTAAASVVLAKDLPLGGALVLLGGLFDILDGVVARVNGKISRFGAFLDSVLDRYSDAFVLLAVAWNLSASGRPLGVYLCLVSLLGSLLISYARARAEGLGCDCRQGLMERPERTVLIALGALTGWIMPTLWILAILTHLTVGQRVYYFWKRTSNS